MEFPKRIYTLEEFAKTRECINKGYKHRLRTIGRPAFKESVREILTLIRKAGYYNTLRTYIRYIVEIDGVSQLREAEATIWLNTYMIKDSIEGARFIVQKVEQMKNYLEGEQYYEKGETSAVEKSVEFLQNLCKKKISEGQRKKCKEAIKLWATETIL